MSTPHELPPEQGVDDPGEYVPTRSNRGYFYYVSVFFLLLAMVGYFLWCVPADNRSDPPASGASTNAIPTGDVPH